MKKRIAIAAAALCAAVLLAVIIYDFITGKTVSDSFLSMDTTVSSDIEGCKADETSALIREEIKRLDLQLLSRTSEDSAIFAINSDSAEYSDEILNLLKEIKEIETASGYSFCIGMGELTDLWGICTEDARLPLESEISAATERIKNWGVIANAVIVPTGVTLDLGAVGKGIACDYARDILASSKCKKAVISVGGSVLLYSKSKNAEFKIGIRNPQGTANEYAAILTAGNACISTSGNYERYFELDGKRYHHIFDPASGYPAESGLQSVTVISDSGLVSDALSTACFVLGIEKSLPLLEKYGAQAIFITNDNEFILTSGIEEFEITDGNFTMGEIE